MIPDAGEKLLESTHIGDFKTSAHGVLEEIHISRIWETSTPIRCGNCEIGKLAQSIHSVGLLQPIVVRFKDDHYEIIAGNRRYAACKLLRWRKIPCHIVDLGDKDAFEVSLAENIQRRTMDPIEEAEAFQRYVTKYGWGSAVGLAMKLGKSSSYISKRLGLLKLPGNVIDKIRIGDLSASIAEELSSLESGEDQSKLGLLISSRRLSLRKARELVHSSKAELDAELIENSTLSRLSCPNRSDMADQALSRAAVALRVALNRIASIMEDVEKDWLVYEELMNHRNALHWEIDLLLKERRKVKDVPMMHRYT